jgi:hypothetical protein
LAVYRFGPVDYRAAVQCRYEVLLESRADRLKETFNFADIGTLMAPRPRTDLLVRVAYAQILPRLEEPGALADRDNLVGKLEGYVLGLRGGEAAPMKNIGKT